MNIAAVSKRKLVKLFEYWHVDNYMATPLYNYLVHGYSPGGFWTKVLEDKFLDAMVSCSENNRVLDMKNASRFKVNCFPTRSYGSEYYVSEWLKLTDDERRKILEDNDLIYTPEQETWETIKGDE